jgi:MSHA pilin protein MshB
MKSLNIQSRHKASQSGFTIIELVVVILLLGILAATALPRFLDLTDEAHSAAFAGINGGLSTAVAMYHADWVGHGSVGSFVEGSPDIAANGSGYPALVASASNDNCKNVFDNILQGGHPEVAAASEAAGVIGDLNGFNISAASNAYASIPTIAAYYLATTQACAYVYTADLPSTVTTPAGAKYISIEINGDVENGTL